MTDRDDKTTAEMNPYCVVCDNYGADGMGCVGYGGRRRPLCFTEIPSGSGQFDVRAAGRFSSRDQHDVIVPPGAAATVAILIFLACTLAPVDGSGAPFAPVKVFQASGAKNGPVATDRRWRTMGSPPLSDAAGTPIGAETMSVRNHPAPCDKLAGALEIVPQATSRKIGEAEQLFEIIFGAAGRLARTGRADRVVTAVITRMRTIVAVARNRPPEELDQWLRNFASRQHRTHGRGCDAVRQKTATNLQALAIDVG